MIDGISSYLEWKGRTKTGTPQPGGASSQLASEARDHRPGFSKVFRWPVSPEQMPQPTTVEVVGSFTDWRRIPLAYDNATKTWQGTLNSIQSNHTHRYVMLVDGKPSYDKTCDGLAIPQSPAESQWQIETPKGPRVMLLFSQTK
jgi:hypothetical protein